MNNNEAAYAAAIAIALIVASVLLVVSYAFIKPAQHPYMTIYLQDSNKKAVDLPEHVVANLNSTFNVTVVVENHMGSNINYAQVQVKTTSNSNPTFPLNTNAAETLSGNLKDGESMEKTATVTLNDPGNYLVVFELWIAENDTSAVQYSGIFTALNVGVSAT